jgi:hypothetical protein
VVFYQKLTGVVRVERVTSQPIFRERRCSETNLMTVTTQFLCNLKTPITAKNLKNDPILRMLPALRRNFQGTCFQVPEEQWKRLRRVIESSI